MNSKVAALQTEIDRLQAEIATLRAWQTRYETVEAALAHSALEHGHITPVFRETLMTVADADLIEAFIEDRASFIWACRDLAKTATVDGVTGNGNGHAYHKRFHL